MDSISKKLLDVARHELGYTEKGSGYTKFGDWYAKHVDPDHDAYFKTAPWCDMFLAWAANEAGVKDSVGEFASTVEHAQWFKKEGAWGGRPEPGAIVFFDWSGSRDIDMIDHVGIVERVEGGRIHTIEANVDGIHLKRKVRSTDMVVGYGYPSRVKVAAPKPESAAAQPGDTAYAPRHAAPAPAPTAAALLSDTAPAASARLTTTKADAAKARPLIVAGEETVLTGMLAVVLVGTMALAIGKARTPRITVTSPVRVRKRGKHHRTGTPVELPADLTPADLELADAGTVMMPAISAAVAAEAEDREFWGRIEHLKEDEELAFWDMIHDSVATSGRPSAERVPVREG